MTHFFHLAAKYDMTATDEENFAANLEGSKYATDLVNSIGGTYHYCSSIAVAGDFNGIFFESMFNEGQLFEDSYLESKFKGEEYARGHSKVPIRIYRPGMVVGSSKTGEADKVDGPYYLFKFLQHLRNSMGNWAVLPCIQGERLPLVPVDYVVCAMDALAHMKGLDGRCFHLVDSSPKLFVDALNIFATAGLYIFTYLNIPLYILIYTPFFPLFIYTTAHSPTFSARLPNLALSLIPASMMAKLKNDVPIVADAPNEVISWILGVPKSVMHYIDWRSLFLFFSLYVLTLSLSSLSCMICDT